MGTVEQTLAGHRTLRKYVLPGERVVLTRRSHWAKLLEPSLTTLAGFALVAWLVDVAATAVGDRSDWLWWLWFVLLARLVWRVLDWRNEWFVATDKRMLMMYGLVTHKVSMMPLVKVTDMRFSRSIAGRILGYGEFLLESAGQDQALGRIAWVADPDATYRDLCAIIFTPAQPPHGRPPSVAVRRPAPEQTVPGRTPWPPVHEHRPGDTEPIRVVAAPAGDDEPGWTVSSDRGTFVPVHDPDGRAED
ncbi:PH domain-containing protein [Cellulomonas fengjieae]|uniref:PH domain-containing protein n=1 Tax=Cellulomonas fengjieae TaxID=2819978 RepID=A0ABS3SGK4_9CELL|nr:PH domain-containing protein [Cellulomonas fengjieae]MBO3084878.1 PH domain-containing protein [Cellulomonas fengjieae]MBO3103842.1 PH domain-containing protein [Cellulomonas fengjieae]QVI66808.1 PH domain-containing protein [Cellulomonas fengjieae]